MLAQEEINHLKSKSLTQFKSGKSLFGKDGAFAPMLKNFLEVALKSEMEEHLDSEERFHGNKGNGKSKKAIKSSTGTFEIEIPQARQSSFESQIVKKREIILADNFEDKRIDLYGLGMSLRDISVHIKRDV